MTLNERPGDYLCKAKEVVEWETKANQQLRQTCSHYRSMTSPLSLRPRLRRLLPIRVSQAMACSVPPTRPKVFETPSLVQAPTSQSPVYAVPGLLHPTGPKVFETASPVHAVPGPLRLILALVGSLLPPLRWLTSPAWDLAHHSSSVFAIRVRLITMLVCLPAAYP